MADDDYLFLDEICFYCGFRLGSHHGGTQPWPRNYCPGHENQMDWENGRGTTFKGTGRYRTKTRHTGKKE